MIEQMLETIRKGLPEGWTAEIVDGVIEIVAPEDVQSVDMVQDLIAVIEQPLTLNYTLTTSDDKVLAAAQEKAAAYGLELEEIDKNVYRICVAGPVPEVRTLDPRIIASLQEGYRSPHEYTGIDDAK